MPTMPIMARLLLATWPSYELKKYAMLIEDGVEDRRAVGKNHSSISGEPKGSLGGLHPPTSKTTRVTT